VNLPIKLLLTLLLAFNWVVQASATSVQDSPDAITIALTIKNGANLPVNISTPINGSFFVGQWTKLKTDKNGQLKTSIHIDSAGFCQVWLNYLPWVGRSSCIQIYAEPGESYTIYLEKDAEFESLRFEGDNVSENTILNSFDRYRVDYWGQSEYLKSILDSEQNPSFLKYIHTLQEHDMELVKTYRQTSPAINRTFINLLQEDIRYYYALLYYVAWNVKRESPETDSVEFVTWENDLKSVIENTPLDNVLALGSFWYNDYRSAVWPLYMDGALEKITKSSRNSLPGITYQLINQNFSRTVKQQFLAYSIRSDAVKNRFSKPVQQQYLRYKTEFPKSPFLPALDKEFEDVLNIKPKTINTTNSIRKNDISSLQELIQLYPNQMLYIDLWASWCGPCKQEFETNSTELNRFIESNNIQLIYIAVDDSTQLQTCQDNLILRLKRRPLLSQRNVDTFIARRT
jgi:thiol-disulfide isomerase/thioredoxin